jgi:hypothetical protein
MRAGILIFIIMLAPVAAFLQPSGFLGALNSIELKYNAVPSTRFHSQIIGNLVSTRIKFVNSSYSVSYSRVLSRNIEITAGYQVANIGFTTYGLYRDAEPGFDMGWNDRYMAQDANAVYHGGMLALNFYRFGSLSPVGKYVSLVFASGVTTVDEETTFIIGERGYFGGGGIFYHRYELQDSTQVAFPEETKIKSTFFKLRMGRNYPLTKNLMLTVGMTAPVFSRYVIGSLSYFGFNLGDENNFELDDDNFYRQYPARSIRAYHLLQFDIGLRFAF